MTMLAAIDHYLAHPWVISSDLTPVVLLPIIPQIWIAYLLFSPNDTVHLRRMLLVPVIGLAVFAATSFEFEDPLRAGQTIGIRGLASWLYMRGIEVALLKNPPAWLGYEIEGRQKRRTSQSNDGEAISSAPASSVVSREAAALIPPDLGQPPEKTTDPKEHNRSPANRWDQFIYGLTYYFAFRLNLGWSNSLGNPDLVPKPIRPRPRGELLLSLVVPFVVSYLAYDASLGMLDVHPSFRTRANNLDGSIWDPLDFYILGRHGHVRLGSHASAVYIALVYAANLVLGIRMFHLYIMVAYTLLHPRPVNAPPVLSLRFLAATSVSEFWSRRWHQMFRRAFTFLGGLPMERLARRAGGGRATQRWAAVVGTFLASGVQHAILNVYLPAPEYRALSRSYFVFFALQPVAMALERLFLLVTGRKVSGPLGAIWLWSFGIWAGIPTTEAMLRAVGAVGHGGGHEGEALMPLGAPARVAWRWLGHKI